MASRGVADADAWCRRWSTKSVTLCASALPWSVLTKASAAIAIARTTKAEVGRPVRLGASVSWTRRNGTTRMAIFWKRHRLAL